MNDNSSDYNVKVDYFIERRCSPSWCIPRNTILFHDLTFLLKGKAIYLIDGIQYNLTGGDIIYIPKGSVREAYTYEEDPMHCYAFNFQCCDNNGDCRRLPLPHTFKAYYPGNPSEFVRISRHTGITECGRIPKHGEINEYERISECYNLMELYRYFNKIWLERNQGYMLEARAILMLILNRYLRMANGACSSASCRDNRVEKIKEYIADEFEAKIDLKLLSKKFNLHPVYLGAYFKKKTGISIHEYINRIRIQRAEDLLVMEECNVTEAALRCGYEDIFYFSRVYKKIKGYPPSFAKQNYSRP